jgi:hypothetical protein
VGFVVEKVVLGQAFFEYIAFPCHSFHRLLRDQRTGQAMEIQWYLESKQLQDTEITKQGVGVCLLGQI